MTYNITIYVLLYMYLARRVDTGERPGIRRSRSCLDQLNSTKLN